jgi:hypothetical protein
MKLPLKRINGIKQSAEKYIATYGAEVDQLGLGMDPPTPTETLSMVKELLKLRASLKTKKK